MNTLGRGLLILIVAVVGWYALGFVFSTLFFLAKVALVGALVLGAVYLVSRASGGKMLGGGGRRSLP